MENEPSREAKLARNEAAYRIANENIAHAAGLFQTDELTCICECSREDCVQLIALSRPEYERVREVSRRFFVVPGHEVPAIEVVVDEVDGRYNVVEKIGEGGAIADELDPRRS